MRKRSRSNRVAALDRRGATADHAGEMPLERCPVCQSDFVVPAHVEFLVQCPRCALSMRATDSSITLFERVGVARAEPRGEIHLSDDFNAVYERGRMLGAGGCGTVYLAHERATGRAVAVKFLTDQHSPTLRARFEREIALLSRMSHPNVVSVLSSGELDGHPYLITEYLDGGTLASRIKAHGRLPPNEAVRIMREVLTGLATCHDLGIVHRDLKPENVLFTAMGRAKITDFGLAKDHSGAHPGLTTSGSMFGTPYYMSPEQIRSEPVSAASDVYSAGIMFFEMLTGQPPFTALTAWELFEHHVHALPPSLLACVPYAPAQLGVVVERALAKAPAARYASAEAFIQALEVD